MITTCLPAAVIGGAPRSPSLHPVRRRQVLHRLVDAVELAARHRQVARASVAPPASTTASKRVAQLRRPSRSTPTSHAGDGTGALGPHLVEPAVQVALFHLELGDAVAQQPADAVVALVDGDGVPGAGQLLRGGEPGRSGADHRDRACRSGARGGCGTTPPVVPGPVDDRRPRPA